MANKKFVDLPALTTMSDTIIVPVSDGTTTKKITGSDLKTYFTDTSITLDGEQTLTNKTLTSPTIDDPTFNGTFAFESNNTDQPAMTLTASNLSDGVGILRVIGSEPDINFNQVSESAGFNTFTFEWNGDPKLAMGRRNDHSFYITRNDGEWHDNTFVLDHATGVLSVESGISVPSINFTDETTQTTAWTGTAAADTLTGNTLASEVTASSLTSVGTLTNLNVTNPISINNKQAVNGPAFSAYASAVLQTITSGSQQKVLFQVEEFDTNNNFASSRFTPTVAGYYQLNAEVRLDGASSTGEIMIVIWKNGAEYKRGTNQSGTQIATNFWAMQVSSLVYANGTGDYFEIYVQQTSGGSLTVTAVNNPAITWFNGCMLRGA